MSEINEEPHEISGEHQGMIEAVKVLSDRRGDRLRYGRDIMFSIIVVLALMLAYVQSRNNEQLLVDAAARTVCGARFQDIVDLAAENQLVTIGELIVIITSIPPGDDRTKAVADKIIELTQFNEEVRVSVNAKIRYNNDGRQLPCPIAETAPSPPTTIDPSSITNPTT